LYIVRVEVALLKQDSIDGGEVARDNVLDSVASEDSFLEPVGVACEDQGGVFEAHPYGCVVDEADALDWRLCNVQAEGECVAAAVGLDPG
jgi:hypothetical protein